MNAANESRTGWSVVHETSTRLRCARADGRLQAATLRAGLARLRGVERVRIAEPLGMVTVHYDGRVATRAAVLQTLDRIADGPADHAPPVSPSTWPAWTEAALQATALAVLPLLESPRPRIGVGLGGVAVHRLYSPPRDAGELLDVLAKIATVVGGFPMAAVFDQLMESVEALVRSGLTRELEHALAHLAPAAPAQVEVRQGRAWSSRAHAALQRGDVVRVRSGDAVPADGRMIAGDAELLVLPAAPGMRAQRPRPGALLDAGRVVGAGELELRVLAKPDRSLIETMRMHVVHALLAREIDGVLQPSLRRAALGPLALATVTYGFTRDATRSAMVLQGDLRGRPDAFHPVARDGAILAMARVGGVPSSLEAVHRLALCSVLVVEDDCLLDARHGWQIEDVSARSTAVAERIRRALGTLIEGGKVELEPGWPLPGSSISRLLHKGRTVRDRDGPLHLLGRRAAARIYDDEGGRAEPEFPHRRELKVFAHGARIGSIHLRAHWADGVDATLARMRDAGLRRIVVCPAFAGIRLPKAKQALFDEVLPAGRRTQRAWLEAQAQAGEHTAVLHQRLRDIVPPGGVSACPMRAVSGAHIALAEHPLNALGRSHQIAQWLDRHLLRQRRGAAVAHAAVTSAGAIREIPPIASAVLRHAVTAWELYDGAQLPRLAQAVLRSTAPHTAGDRR